MNPAARIQDAGPAQLVRLLEDALRWLREEWFEPWLSDEAQRDPALNLVRRAASAGAASRHAYLEQRLDEVAIWSGR